MFRTKSLKLHVTLALHITLTLQVFGVDNRDSTDDDASDGDSTVPRKDSYARRWH